MSNCIIFDNPIIQIPVIAVNLHKVKEILALGDVTYKTSPKQNEIGTIAYLAWWFFNSSNVDLAVDSVEITLGIARSSHTWRDFKGLLECIIKPFMIRSYVVTLEIRDECDDFEQVSKLTIDLQSPEKSL